MKVLVVDDEPLARDRLRRLLAAVQADAECFFASNGEEALEQVAVTEPDLLLLDIRMPGMDGIETLHEIKKNHPLLGVIILTGYATVKTSVEAMKTGAFEYLEKPYDIEQLVAIIKAALARKRKFEDRIFDAKIKPYCSGRERKRLITDLIDDAAGSGRRSRENEEK